MLIGTGAGFFPRSRALPAAIACGACLAALAAITGLSAFWASDSGAAFDEGVIALAYTGVFTLVVLASASGETRAWLCGLAIGLVAVAVLALGARLEPSLFGDGERELIERLAVANGRLSEPFLYWNALAAAMASALILLTWLGAAAESRRARALAVGTLPMVGLVLYMTTSRGGTGAAVIGVLVLLAIGPWRVRLLGALAIGGLLGGFLIAFTASGPELLDDPLSELGRDQARAVGFSVIGVVLFAGALAYMADPIIRAVRAPDFEPSRRLAIGLAAAAIALLGALVVYADPVERWEQFKSPPEDTFFADPRDLSRGDSSGRYQFWSTAADAFEEDPLKGIGGGGFEYWWNREGTLDEPAPNAHSLFFDTAGELGILGLAAVVGFAGIAVAGGLARIRVRRSRAAPSSHPDLGASAAALAILLAGLAGAAFDWTWENPGAFVAVVVAAALLTGPASAPRPDPADLQVGERRSRRRFAGGVFMLGFAWIGICASALLLLTSRALDSSRDAFASADLEAAADAAEDAINLQPWSAEPRQQLGLVLEAQGDTTGALREIAEALERSPEDWRLWLVSARLELRADNEAGARYAVGVARGLAPRLVVFDRPTDEILDGLL